MFIQSVLAVAGMLVLAWGLTHLPAAKVAVPHPLFHYEIGGPWVLGLVLVAVLGAAIWAIITFGKSFLNNWDH